MIEAATLSNSAIGLSEPADMFSPDHYKAMRRPLDQAETLPAWCYTSERFYKREVERIFLKVWNFLGRADRIPNPGDYFTLTFAGIPLIIARGDDGKVRAFANSCRHRGSIVALGEGNCRAFKCPYHSWAFALDGTLLGAPSMEKTANFDPADYGLIEVRLESWGGFIFVNFDKDAPDLMSFLGDLPERLASYNYEEMVCVRRVEYELNCNWKIYVENAMEAYHVPYVHKSTLQRQKGPTAQPIETRGEWVGLFKEHTGSRALLAGETGFPPIPSLTGPAAAGTHYPLIYPSTMFGATIDCMWWLEIHPIAADRMRLIVGSAFPKDVVARPDFEEIVTRYYRRWDVSIPEDNEISELQQRGLSSPLYREGRFSHLEPLVHAIDNWVLDQVLDPA
ncbi:aromatic ring-hydroxylating oxygenase subunit alpha [Oceanibaculum indicum]|uniref:Phenylpropionate dioxygenase-like ring-hydroxylating dioxygenase large terminal subunit n=1 Tax=Oceanibaculum indicum TaxID=526216 RepID=A0A420WFT7_9PROT|nr:aromatic ring-hydroxylating dioxygenase subunit alpha [Oceanibaculum indicum]RKQ69836.1 phenylpropionate dioxygenase-like ring-hydroxylating dioxygenase large terminal subunit [Oceanibaculum indicum]